MESCVIWDKGVRTRAGGSVVIREGPATDSPPSLAAELLLLLPFAVRGCSTAGGRVSVGCIPIDMDADGLDQLKAVSRLIWESRNLRGVEKRARGWVSVFGTKRSCKFGDVVAPFSLLHRMIIN